MRKIPSALSTATSAVNGYTWIYPGSFGVETETC